MIINEQNHVEMQRGQFILLNILLIQLSKKDPTLPVAIEAALAECENALSMVKDPVRSEFQRAIAVARRALNELPRT